jgi:hypothetical protein
MELPLFIFGRFSLRGVGRNGGVASETLGGVAIARASRHQMNCVRC